MDGLTGPGRQYDGPGTGVGVPLLRLLAEESGLRAGLSKALRKDFHPAHDRGQVVTDVAVALAHGAGRVTPAASVQHQARLSDNEVRCAGARSQRRIEPARQ